MAMELFPNASWKLKFPCTFKGCLEAFKTEQELVRHKINTPEHVYCEKCEVDCKDFDDFVKHKVLNAEHICCPLCGQDFGSKGGLDRHIRITHQRDQRIICTGCKTVFLRAGGLIQHLESGKCPGITQHDFQDQLHRKDIIGRILKDPETFGSNYSTIGSVVKETRGTNTWECDEGGVSLGPLDEIAEKDAVHLGPTLKPSIKNTASMLSDITNHSIASRFRTSGFSSDVSGKETEKERHGRMNAECDALSQRDFPALSRTTIRSKETDPLANWAQTVSKTPCQDAPKDPSTAMFKAGVVARNNQYAAENPHLQHPSTSGITQNKEGVFYQKFWHPDSVGYSPELFYQAIIDRYICPFRHCQKQFESPLIFGNHLKSGAHRIDRHRCPTCLREFKSSTALVQHCESPSTNCWIRDTEHFGEAIDKFTGGYLEVQRAPQGEDKKTAQDPYGRGPVYAAARPADFW